MKAAYNIVILQLGIAVIAAFAWWYLADKAAGGSAIIAGVTSVVPNLLFALRFFSRRQPRVATQVLRRFYQAEALKILLTVTFFYIGIRYLHAVFLPFVTTYMLCQLTFWLAPWLRTNNRVISV